MTDKLLMQYAKAVGQAWAIIDNLISASTKKQKSYAKKRAKEWLKENK